MARDDKRIEKLGEEKYPQTLRVRSIRGVGPITSLAFVLNLGNDPARSKTNCAAGPRMGLRPKQRESGKRALQLSIAKSGDPMLRHLLVQCGQYVLEPTPTSPTAIEQAAARAKKTHGG